MVVSEPVITLLASLHNPLLKCRPHEGVDHVADVLPRHLLGLPELGECIDDLPEGHAVLEELEGAEALILRHGDVLDVVTMDGL